MIQRGDIWWADLDDPRGSEPGFRRPVLVVSSDDFNASRIQTVLAVSLTSNLKLAEAPGNVLLASHVSGLPKNSVANVSQVVTLDKAYLVSKVSSLSGKWTGRVDAGLMLALGLRLN